MKKHGFLVLVLVMAASLLIGCAGEKRQLNILIAGGLSEPNEKLFFDEFVSAFKDKEKAEVNITYSSQADGITKIKSEIDNRNVTTDIVFVDTANMGPYTQGGWTEDITELVRGFPVTFTDMFDASTNRDGKRYFMPISFDIYIFLANRLALPYMPPDVEVKKDGSGKVTEITKITWEQFRDWGNAIAAAGQGAKTGFPTGTSGSQLLYPLGGVQLAYGLDVYPKIDHPATLVAFGIIAEMARGKSVLDAGLLSQYNRPMELIKNGDLWLSFAHMGPLGDAYKAAPDAYVLGPGPVGSTGKTGSTAGAWTLGIVKGAKNRELAEKWLAYNADQANNYRYCKGLGGVMSPVKEAGALLGEGTTDRIMRAGIDSLATGARVTGLPTADFVSWDAVKMLYTDIYNAVLSGKTLTQADITAYQDQLDGMRK
ncbi:MAG: ABC transporter substrate-binding protein [Spirochaetaceae bacterium]|jgi:multiple sugar transport system substrate-binding protein|nr:ABC transporter substrate-binding protein [Spirochaetaceae bacterium]